MSAEVPDLSESCELHWKNLFEGVQELTDPREDIYAILKVEPFADGTDPAVDEKGKVKEITHYPLDDFQLYVTAGERHENYLDPVWLGNGKRKQDPDSKRFDYKTKIIGQLRHEVGLRLERLKSLERNVYFTSKLLGYEAKEVTQEFIDGLLNSDNKELGIVKEQILE